MRLGSQTASGCGTPLNPGKPIPPSPRLACKKTSPMTLSPTAHTPHFRCASRHVDGDTRQLSRRRCRRMAVFGQEPGQVRLFAARQREKHACARRTLQLSEGDDPARQPRHDPAARPVRHCSARRRSRCSHIQTLCLDGWQSVSGSDQPKLATGREVHQASPSPPAARRRTRQTHTSRCACALPKSTRPSANSPSGT